MAPHRDPLHIMLELIVTEHCYIAIAQLSALSSQLSHMSKIRRFYCYSDANIFAFSYWLTTPPPEGSGFFFHHAFTNNKLTVCYPATVTPEANAACPAAILLLLIYHLVFVIFNIYNFNLKKSNLYLISTT